MDKYTILQNSTVGVFIVLLVMVLWTGLHSGQARAQSQLIVTNAQAIVDGIGYFRSDYDRYPTVLEFETPALMRSYVHPWPDVQFASKTCTQSIGYESSGFDRYTLVVCLPAGYKDFPRGISEFTVSE